MICWVVCDIVCNPHRGFRAGNSLEAPVGVCVEGRVTSYQSKMCSYISTHALGVEGDLDSRRCTVDVNDFYPLPPRGGRQQILIKQNKKYVIKHQVSKLKSFQKIEHSFFRPKFHTNHNQTSCERYGKKLCAPGSQNGRAAGPGPPKSSKRLQPHSRDGRRCALPSTGNDCPAGKSAGCPFPGR